MPNSHEEFVHFCLYFAIWQISSMSNPIGIMFNHIYPNMYQEGNIHKSKSLRLHVKSRGINMVL